MTTQEQAEKLAMEAAFEIVFNNEKCNRNNKSDVERTILSTIPLKEMLDCVENQRAALVEAERVLDVMYGFYRHRGPWETIHGSQTLEKVRQAILTVNLKPS